MKVAAVLVNYGQWELTRKSIGSLRASTGVDLAVTLVDNCSPGPVPEWVEKEEGLRFLRLDENTGYSGGNNEGFRLSLQDGAELTLFLNNDATVMPDTVGIMASRMEEDPGTGILAPAIYRASDPGSIWSAGGRLVRWKMRFRQVELPEEAFQPGRTIETDFVSGCAMMVRTSLFEELGGFREDLFMYYEDAELCWRARNAGFRVRVIPSASVLHEVGSSSGGEQSVTAMYFSERNRILLSRSMLGPFHRAVFLIYKTAVLLVYTVRFAASGDTGLVAWTWKGYLDGLAGRSGNRDGLTGGKSPRASGSSEGGIGGNNGPGAAGGYR
ncbi:MAG: hypothetical protein AVO35_01740 [Candidatus Aegiribacteria sp. MLS_C]|nr:MAG: hypothetical protein AVO35_01740 [Candidatus Aegiribacteria sp. MLS_C]